MNNYRSIKPVKSKNEINFLINKTERMVDSTFFFNDKYIEEKSWEVVPVESASHFDKNDIKQIVSGIKTMNKQFVYAVATETLKAHDMAFVVPISIEGLSEFNQTNSLYNYVLFPEDEEFAILCTTDDYFLVAGKKETVERLIGSTIKIAKERFDKFAYDVSWPEPMRKHFTSIAQKYE